ncbi:hypothetical protein BH11PSE3_BH11PSE3_04930 [soil metagenome]
MQSITEGGSLGGSTSRTCKPTSSQPGASRSKIVAAILAVLWLSLVPAFAQSTTSGGAEGPLGHWLTDNGNLEIEIALCGQAYCGTVTKVLANRSMSGGADMTGADNRSPLGMTILKNFVPSAAGEWQGEIYNRENGKTYSCKISLAAPDQLAVRAYVGLPLFGKTLVWTRLASHAGQK